MYSEYRSSLPSKYSHKTKRQTSLLPEKEQFSRYSVIEFGSMRKQRKNKLKKKKKNFFFFCIPDTNIFFLLTIRPLNTRGHAKIVKCLSTIWSDHKSSHKARDTFKGKKKKKEKKDVPKMRKMTHRPEINTLY